MCYSKLTLKGASPVNEPYKFFYLKVTGETKMTQNMNMNSEQTLTISQCCFAKTLWHFCGARNTEKMDALNEQVLRFLSQDYSSL